MFEIGQQFRRKQDLHEVYGGQRQSGISTPAGKPFIFTFKGDAGAAHGYEDRFQPDGT